MNITDYTYAYESLNDQRPNLEGIDSPVPVIGAWNATHKSFDPSKTAEDNPRHFVGLVHAGESPHEALNDLLHGMELLNSADLIK